MARENISIVRVVISVGMRVLSRRRACNFNLVEYSAFQAFDKETIKQEEKEQDDVEQREKEIEYEQDKKEKGADENDKELHEVTRLEMEEQYDHFNVDFTFGRHQGTLERSSTIAGHESYEDEDDDFVSSTHVSASKMDQPIDVTYESGLDKAGMDLGTFKKQERTLERSRSCDGEETTRKSKLKIKSTIDDVDMRSRHYSSPDDELVAFPSTGKIVETNSQVC